MPSQAVHQQSEPKLTFSGEHHNHTESQLHSVQVKTMESGLYIPKAVSPTLLSVHPDAAKPRTSPNPTPAAAAQGPPAAAEGTVDPALAASPNPLGSAIHQNLAERLKAAKVPGHAGTPNPPAGAPCHSCDGRGTAAVCLTDSRMAACYATKVKRACNSSCEVKHQCGNKA